MVGREVVAVSSRLEKKMSGGLEGNCPFFFLTYLHMYMCVIVPILLFTHAHTQSCLLALLQKFVHWLCKSRVKYNILM